MTQPWIEGRFEEGVVLTTWSSRSTGPAKEASGR